MLQGRPVFDLHTFRFFSFKMATHPSPEKELYKKRNKLERCERLATTGFE